MLAMVAGTATPFESRNANAGVNFVGSNTCALCHRTIYDEFRKTSMGRSFGEASPHLKMLLPESTEVRSSTPGHAYQVFWEEGRLYQSESFIDENGARAHGTRFSADYIIGSGASGYTFLFRRGNRLFEAPLSYYSRTRSWDLSPGFDAYDAGFTRPVRIACLECHIGRLAAVGKADTDFATNAFTEQAIGCENCHGPGELHVRERGATIRATSPDDSIVNPARLSRPLANDICIRCHQGNDARVFRSGKTLDDFRPGTPLSNILYIFKVPLLRDRKAQQSDLLEHGFAMMLSKCYLRSTSMTCTTCHSVHRNVEPAEKAAYYRSKCLTCHSVASCGLDISQRGPDDCISCHMPKRAVATVAHTALTNHRIVRGPDAAYPDAAYFETPNTPGLINVTATTGADKQRVPEIALLEAYRALLTQAPWLQERYLLLLDHLKVQAPDNPIVLAAAGHELVASNSSVGAKQAIPLLQKALQAAQFDSDVYLDLADALSKQRRIDEAVNVLKQGLARDPYEPKVYKALIALALKAEKYADAISAGRDYLRLYPADQKVRTLLNELHNMTAN
jgi:Flp pilus assembly protein TadD